MLAGGDTRLDYIQNRTTKDEMQKTEEENLQEIQNNLKLNQPIDPHTHFANDMTNDDVPIHRNGRLGDPFSELLNATMKNMNNMNNNNPNMTNMNNFGPFGNAFSASFSSSFSQSESNSNSNMMSSSSSSSSQNNCMENNEKHDNFVSFFERNIHLAFVFLFVILLIFYPDIDIFGYNIESDTFTFFIVCEFVLFSIFFGYKYYRKYMTPNQNVCLSHFSSIIDYSYC